MTTDDPAITEDLQQHFGPSLPSTPDVLAELHSILRLYSLDPQELFYKWESWCIQQNSAESEVVLTLQNVRNFKKDVQAQLQREVRQQSRVKKEGGVGATPGSGVKIGRGTGLDELIGMGGGIMPGTPSPSLKRKLNPNSSAVKPSLLGGETPTPKKRPTDVVDSSPLSQSATPRASAASHLNPAGTGTPFTARRNPGLTTETLNPHLPLLTHAPLSSPLPLTASFEPKKYQFRTCHMKPTAASDVLDDRIDAYAEALGLGEEEVGNPSVVRMGDCVAVGRVVGDSNQGGRLNTASLLLETSRRYGAGARVPLRLAEELKSFAFFPGQIVAVRGTNAGGGYFAVKEVLSLPPLPLAASSVDEFAEEGYRIAIASGPWTMDNSLLFEPLKEFCGRFERGEERAEVVVLMGPFIDTEHPLIKNGDFSMAEAQVETLDELFRECVAKEILRIPSGTTVLLMPHVRDACNRHACFPQEAFELKALGLSGQKHIKSLPSPAVFKVGDVVLGCTTNDILFHLSKEELVRNPAHQNMLARLPSHLISQRNFYPLFPSPSGNLDVPYLGLTEFVEAVPDLLVTPSELKGFAKVVDGVVCLNPGVMAKRFAAGGWARVTVGRREVREGEGEGGVVENKAWERCRIDLVKI
ncbi:DNA-directed DNA polymerase alpha subunit pol12 [Saitoella coloradoensis]